MRSIFLKIVASSLIVSIISALLYAILQFLPFKFVVAYDVYVFFIILGISLFLAGSITEPLERLRHGFNSLLNGELVQVEINTNDELEDFGEFFNTVARKLIEREKILRETEEKYRNLVENLKDWIFETDADLNIVFSNMHANEIFNEGKIIGKNLRDFISEVPEPAGIERTFEAVLLDSRIFEFSLNPIYKENKLSGYIGIGRDITEKKKAEERMAHLAAITEHSIDAIVSLDIDGNVVSWNKGAEVMFGYKAEEMIGKPLAMLIPPELHDECGENFKKAIVEGYTKNIETIRIAKDGRKIFVDQTLTAIYNANGEITGFVAIMRDITEKKKNELKLMEAYEELKIKTAELRYLANIVENSNDAIYSIDMNGIITSWNKTAERLFGWKKEEAIGMHAKELTPEGFEKETEYIIQRVKDGARNLSFEMKRKCKDGNIIDVEVTVSPILDENGDLSGVSIIARDASNKVRSEQELLRKTLKYKVEVGRTYLTYNFDLAKEVLVDMLKTGFNGTIVSRRLPDEIDVNCNVLWLSEREGKNVVKPKVEDIKRAILELPAKNNVVVFELDYLLTKIDFNSLLALIQSLKEDFYVLRRGVLIIVVRESILNERQLSLLKVECKALQKKEVKISHELYELLRFVYTKNRVGEKPSIKDTMEELGLARNTVKKRIKQLMNRGLLNVVKYGRTKLLEVTEEGKTIFI